jgi:hypothetical protein
MPCGLTRIRVADRDSVRVVGYSHSRQAILTVILVRRDDGGFWGANGWESNSSDRRRYEKGS